MSTKTVSTLSAKERQQLAVDLLTRSSVTKQNYYSLYVTNTQVKCICRIWNRIVYCLFSWLGWFLGKAGDTSKQISMKQENTLIQNYNQAKKALLKALNGKDRRSYSQAESNYIAALNARVEQIGKFAYSAEATQKGCKIEQMDLISNAYDDLGNALLIALPQSLMSAWRKSLRVNQTPPPPENPVKKKVIDTRQAVIEALKKAPHIDSVDKTVINNYIEAFKAYAKTQPDDFALFYTELKVLGSMLSVCHNCHLPLLREFAFRFDLLTNDTEFLKSYSALICDLYIDDELRFVATLDFGRGAYAHLQLYAQEVGEIYALKHSGRAQDAYVKSAVFSLFTQLNAHKEAREAYERYAKNHDKMKINLKQQQTLDLANHLNYFALDPTSPQVSEFIERVLNFKPEESNNSSSTASPPVPSTSASTSVPASSSSSSSSTTSQVILAEPVKKKATFTFDDFASARDALLEELREKQTVERMQPLKIHTFIDVTKGYRAQESGTDLHQFGGLLDNLELACRTKELWYPFEILTLQVRLAKDFGICTNAFLSKAISDSIQQTIESGFNYLHPSTIVNKKSTPYEDFYITIKKLCTSVNPDVDCAAYAKGKLEELFTQVSQQIRTKYIQFSNQQHTSKDHETIKTLIQINAALRGFQKDANEHDVALAQHFLTTIIEKAEKAKTMPVPTTV